MYGLDDLISCYHTEALMKRAIVRTPLVTDAEPTFRRVVVVCNAPIIMVDDIYLLLHTLSKEPSTAPISMLIKL